MPAPATVSVEHMIEPRIEPGPGDVEPPALRPLTEQALLAALANLTMASR